MVEQKRKTICFLTDYNFAQDKDFSYSNKFSNHISLFQMYYLSCRLSNHLGVQSVYTDRLLTDDQLLSAILV